MKKTPFLLMVLAFCLVSCESGEKPPHLSENSTSESITGIAETTTEPKQATIQLQTPSDGTTNVEIANEVVITFLDRSYNFDATAETTFDYSEGHYFVMKFDDPDSIFAADKYFDWGYCGGLTKADGSVLIPKGTAAGTEMSVGHASRIGKDNGSHAGWITATMKYAAVTYKTAAEGAIGLKFAPSESKWTEAPAGWKAKDYQTVTLPAAGDFTTVIVALDAAVQYTDPLFLFCFTSGGATEDIFVKNIGFFASEAEANTYYSTQNSAPKPDTSDPHASDPYMNFNDLPSGRAKPAPITFTWKNAEGEQADTLHLALDPSFADEWCFPVTGSQAELTGLMGGTTYYWKLTGAHGSFSDVYRFTTADSPRIITIDGASNCRDMGGWPTADGGKMLQGLVYRTATLDNITEEGIAYCHDVLGIRTELDLRNEGEETAGATLLGDHVQYVRISPGYYIDAGHSIYDEKYKENMRQIFALFADEDNYPILFHCSAGTDRTGTIAFLLEALCGVSQEDIFHEHDMSLLSILTAGERETMKDHYFRLFMPMYQSMVKRGDGTLQENTEQYFRDIGLTDVEIAAIRRNLTGSDIP